MRRMPQSLVCTKKDTSTGVTCTGSEMTVAISCFLYYFVLLINLSKNDADRQGERAHSTAPGVQGCPLLVCGCKGTPTFPNGQIFYRLFSKKHGKTWKTDGKTREKGGENGGKGTFRTKKEVFGGVHPEGEDMGRSTLKMARARTLFNYWQLLV